MTQLVFKHLNDVTHSYDLILFDLWGVIVEGESTYSGITESMNKLIDKKDVMFLTNAPRPSHIVARNLRNLGMPKVVEDMVVTSGDIARQIMHKHSISTKRTPIVYHLGEDRNKDLLKNFEHELTEDINNAEIFLLSIYRDEGENIHEFNELLKQVAQKNLLTICSNPDTTIPKHGILRYCSGYFANIIEKAGGKVIYTGKPKSIIYDSILNKKPNLSKDRILMVGDTFETDIMGANKAGIDSALVLSGNAHSFHNMHESMEDKLLSLYEQAQKIKAMPRFITSII